MSSKINTTATTNTQTELWPKHVAALLEIMGLHAEATASKAKD